MRTEISPTEVRVIMTRAEADDIATNYKDAEEFSDNLQAALDEYDGPELDDDEDEDDWDDEDDDDVEPEILDDADDDGVEPERP